MSEEKKWVNPIPEREKEIQKFWEDNKIFEKSLEQTKDGKQYSFYDGPPFATGTPHYGHMVASLMKDVVPRFWTMRGRYVERRWGWDCHGLPIENMVEKELGFKSKKDIEEYGVAKFNEYCRSKVLMYVEEWKKTIKRFGRWADMEDSYKTMDLSYMESIWWVFKELYDKGLVYEGYRSMHICPRCETTLSQQEVSEGYRDIKDLSATAKFELVDEPGTFVLAWTTTPWTLPGNVALAVGEDVDYAKIKIMKGDFTGQTFIIAKGRLVDVLKNGGVLSVDVDDVSGGGKEALYECSYIKGAELVGKKYKPLFPYYLDKDLPNKENLYTIVSADFVTTTDGTGVVHIAPAYGEEDMQLGKEKNLSFIQNVTMAGNFKDEVVDFVGLNVKPADDTQKTDVEIIKYLAGKGLLFAKEKYEHSYPHCWRCDTPLINYATSSWFVKVTDIKETALGTAKNINWSPEHIKEGRFGKWLEGARDWSISRQRFWASVMPIWKCDCGETKVFGSIADLADVKIDRNNFFAIRHGQSEKNVKQVFSSDVGAYELTEAGKEMVNQSLSKIIEQKIDVIVCSEVLRAKQTAEIIAKELGLEVAYDSRLNEINAGQYEGKSDIDEAAHQMLDAWRKDYDVAYPDGESANQVGDRMLAAVRELNEKYQGKNILIVSHGDTIRMLASKLSGKGVGEIFKEIDPKMGEFMKLEQAIVDLHKHVIDGIEVPCSCGKKMKRVPDVLDTWFDSGSMPYAQQHYPFEDKKKFEAGFPAEFIAEGVDQTRAWFYYLHIIASAIKNEAAFKNVIVNGIVLAGDGKKMSKRLANYTDPGEIMEQYGADALRYYLLTSPVMQAENVNFDDNGVKEAMQKVTMLLNNVLSFYKTYEQPNEKKESLMDRIFHHNKAPQSENILDAWLLSKLNALIAEVTKQMEAYDLPRSARPIQEFIDEFSTWWLRRSRDRFKSENEIDKQQALVTFRFVLLELSKVMAPFTPFIAERIYKEVGGKLESVHLEKWPEMRGVDDNILSEMNLVRKAVELGLAARSEANIKIRQPLSELSIYGINISEKLAAIVADEVNVKKVLVNNSGEIKVELNTEITEDLKLEGVLRELIRTINGMRKDAGLTIKDKIKIKWETEGEASKKVLSDPVMSEELRKATITQQLQEENLEEKPTNINGEKVKLLIEKL